MFDANKVLLEYARFIDTASRSIEDNDGNHIGLSNTLKQLTGQSQVTGNCTITVDGKDINTALNRWVPARLTLGFDGEPVTVNSTYKDIKTKHYKGYADKKMAVLESAYLVSWLAVSVLNGRFPTSGAANVEMSHKSNALLRLTSVKGIDIVSATIPGHIVKGYQLPDLNVTGRDLKTMCKYFSQVSVHMIENLDKAPKQGGRGLNDRPDWMNL